MSNNLNLPQVAAAQDQKEVTINMQAAEIDAAITVKAAFPVDNTNALTLTAAQLRGTNIFHITNAGTPPTADITLTLPAISRGVFVVVNETSFAVAVEITGQAVTPPIVATGSDDGVILTTDGVNVRQAGGSGSGGGSGGGGSTDFNKVSTGHVVGASATVGFDLTGYFNRGILHTIKITETGGVSTGTYDVRLYKKDTKLAADLMYSVDAIGSTADSRIYRDDLVVYYRDDDGSDELHVQIDNNDGSNSMTFTIEVDGEVFETGIGGGGGDVVGPGSAVDSNVALFDSTTGKLIKDSGLTLSGINTGDTGLGSIDSPIINGGLQVWQRGTTFNSSGSNALTADRFQMEHITGGAVNVTRLTLADAAIQTASGQRIPYALRATVATIDTSIASNAFMSIRMNIEASQVIKYLHNQFTVSFIVRSNITGTFALSLASSGQDRSFIKTFTIDVANTWERKTITVPVQDGSGTWTYTTGTGLICRWTLMAGVDSQGTDNVWNPASGQVDITTSAQTNWMATLSNTFDLTGVQMDFGPTAFPYRQVPLVKDIAMCQRYFQKSYDLTVAPGTISAPGQYAYRANGVNPRSPLRWYSQMRALPTVTFYDPADGTAGQWRDVSAAAGVAVTAQGIGTGGCEAEVAVTADGNRIIGHWVASSEL